MNKVVQAVLSSPHCTALQCDWFVDVTWVDAYGEVHVSPKGSEEAIALCGGLGLFGTITELTLQLTEHSNTHFFTWYLKDDSNIAEDVEKMLKVSSTSLQGAEGPYQPCHWLTCLGPQLKPWVSALVRAGKG